ncbi:cytochrome o ubiquinol oxidase subunit IV [Novosphingobium sp.]|uniref:cytochrome o ubiquinol oxidase subunit IV n=1 Tax=Novosphingobium sp. TaxID=1874826 RepID=UPI003341E133
MSAVHTDTPHDDVPHFSGRDYAVGFAASAVLTAVPFALVMGGGLHDKLLTGLVIAGFAVAQIVVHMVCFLHMNTRSQGGWNFLALAFTAVLVLIVLSGSMWVMYHLNENMMPQGAMPPGLSDQP